MIFMGPSAWLRSELRSCCQEVRSCFKSPGLPDFGSQKHAENIPKTSPGSHFAKPDVIITKEMNPITRESMSKLVPEPSFRAVGQKATE